MSESSPEVSEKLSAFVAVFYSRLGTSARWEAFLTIADILLTRARPIVVLETGTARTQGNWAGDGQSTLVWDYLCRVTDGFGYSIDNDEGACAVARRQVEAMSIACDDSIRFLSSVQDLARRTDLLYLDSFDWSRPRQAESCLHHVGELAAVWNSSSCLKA